MKLKLYQIDAFTDHLFGGNPAAVCPLDGWLDDELMQNIALENNLSETAFLVKEGENWRIRWFTPTVEVDLCGHATLASGYVLLNILEKGNEVNFESKSGPLKVYRDGEWLVLNFPVDRIKSVENEELTRAIGHRPTEMYQGRSDYLLIYPSQKDVLEITPDFRALYKLGARGIIVSAPGEDCDFVSRFFAPGSGIDEDPVTGSIHTTLTHYWSEKLSKTNLVARQLSKRGGYLKCRLEGERVHLAGKARKYLEGEIFLN